MLDPRAFLINNKTGRVVATTFIEFLGGNSTTPSICFTDSPDSGLQCDNAGAVNYIKNGTNLGELGTASSLIGGSDTQIQFNNSGSFGGSADLTWDDTSKELGVGGDINLDDGGTYSTTLQMVTATANRTISFPDATGTVALVAGSSGQLTYNNAGAQAGLTSASIGSTGEINISLAGAASTPPVSFTGSWFTGGTSTTTKPQLLIEPTGTTSTAWSTSGTGLGVNAASGFAGRLLDLQLNGTSRMVVQGDGKLGIGTTSAEEKLDVDGAITWRGALASGKTSAGALDRSGNDLRIRAYGSTSGTGQLVFRTGGGGGSVDNEAVRIDASQRLLVGTSTSVLTGSTTAAIAQLSSPVGLAIRRNSNDSGAANIVFGKSRNTTDGLFTIVQDNDVIGSIRFAADDGTDMVTNAATIEALVDGTPGADDMPGRLVFSTTADGASSPTERMRITSDGSIRAAMESYASNPGTTNYGWELVQNGANPFINHATNGTTLQTIYAFINDNGIVGTIQVTGSSTLYNTSSDYRLKENVVPLTGAADRLKQIPVHRFNFIADPDTTVDGFLAHEAQAVVPECVTGIKDEVDDEGNPVYQGIDQSKLVPLLTAALQEALAKIETLEQRLNDAGIA